MNKYSRSANFLTVMVTTCMVVIIETRPTSYDMQAVGSLHRDVRQQPALVATEVSDLLAIAPSKQHNKKHKNTSGKSNEGGFYKQFGSDADGEKGYLKKSYADGNHGYKNYDTFHKTLGDRYGFEEHEETGKLSAADSNHQQQQTKRKQTKNKQNADHEGAGTDDVESYYSGEGGDYSGYSGGGDGGDSESSSYSSGSGEGYSESYSSGDDDGGDGESHSSGESYSSSGESDGSYY